MNFCRRCGTKLTKEAETHYLCETGHTLFVNPAPTSGIFFLTENNNVLMSIRGMEPSKGMLDAFGGFVDPNESAEKAIEREMIEELGLTSDQYEEPKFICTATSHYDFGGETRLLLGTFFYSRLKPGANPVPMDDVAGIEEISLDHIDPAKIDAEDVITALEKLRQIISV